jgi:hypothetical protein
MLIGLAQHTAFNEYLILYFLLLERRRPEPWLFRRKPGGSRGLGGEGNIMCCGILINDQEKLIFPSNRSVVTFVVFGFELQGRVFDAEAVVEHGLDITEADLPVGGVAAVGSELDMDAEGRDAR